MGVVATTSSLGRLGPYELLRRLATGGMSEVYEARRAGPRGFSKRIALKRILPQLTEDPELVAMFGDEARLSAQLSHPNLVQVFDFGEEGGELYMAMELVEGTTCAKVLREVSDRKETVPTPLALYIGLSVARGLEHAHEACDDQGKPLHLIHRDVSPGNILLGRSGAVKLSDFGIARATVLERRTEHGQLKGKLGYMSPEQVLGRELDEKSDQFSTGIVIAEMLIGRPLFGGGREIDILVRIRDAELSRLARHGSHISEDVRAMLLRALARDPSDRYPSSRAFVEAIEDVMRRAGFVVRPATLSAYLDRLGLASAPGISRDPACDDCPRTRPGPSLARTEPCDPPKARRYAPIPAPLLRASEPLSPPGDDLQRARYRVSAKGGELGPLSIAEVAKLFATGVIDAETPIARGASAMGPVQELRELERLAAMSKARWELDAGPSEREHRILDRLRFPEWLTSLMLAQFSGLLVVRDGRRQTKAYFTEGVLETTTSTEPHELLGSLLVASGMATADDVERAVTISLQYGGRMGDALVALGVLRPMTLCRALSMQTRRRFVELLSWQAGEVILVPGARSYEEDTMPERLPPLDLVAQGIREGYACAELAELMSPLLDRAIAPVVRPPVGIASLRLTRKEAEILAMIDHARRVSEVVAPCEREELATTEEAYRALFIGLSLKLVEICV